MKNVDELCWMVHLPSDTVWAMGPTRSFARWHLLPQAQKMGWRDLLLLLLNDVEMVQVHGLLLGLSCWIPRSAIHRWSLPRGSSWSYKASFWWSDLRFPKFHFCCFTLTQWPIKHTQLQEYGEWHCTSPQGCSGAGDQDIFSHLLS